MTANHQEKERKQITLIALLLLCGLLYGTQLGGNPYIRAAKNRIEGLQAPPLPRDTTERVVAITPDGREITERRYYKSGADSLSSASKERIFIENVDLWKFDKEENPDAQILTGNVIFRHKDAWIYCDSACLYEQQNRFEAYNNVRIEQGDSLFIYCNYLDYDGQAMLARLRELVRMEHGENTLYTDSLDYDRNAGIGYYFDYGSIVDTLNTLSSVYGEYSTITKQATFQNEVKLENPNFTLYSDTLQYDTETKLATILGPTRIVGDSGVIHATRGIYDTEQDKAYLMDSPIIESGTRWMTGDSTYYDRKAGLAKMYHNVILRDTLEKVELRGDYVEYHEKEEHGIAKEKAYLTEYSSEDTLYVHAETMEMLKVDSTANLFKGLNNVRLYRRDMQAVCDSIFYHTGDSIMRCVGHPFVWSGKSQVTGDSLTIYMDSTGIDYAHIQENAFLSSFVRDDYYEQMRGREALAYFSDKSVDSLWMKGNAEIIHYTQAVDSIVLEQLKSQSSAIFMRFLNEEVEKIVLHERTVGTITPVALLAPEDRNYPNFVWFPEGRPTSPMDIFRKTPTPGASNSASTPPPGYSSSEDTTTKEEGKAQATLPKDSTIIVKDSLSLPPDSLTTVKDSLAIAKDSLTHTSTSTRTASTKALDPKGSIKEDKKPDTPTKSTENNSTTQKAIVPVKKEEKE